MSNRCRIYARVSSDKQAKDDTIANQISKSVERDIERTGLVLTGHYTDNGKSASAGKLHLRGDWHKAMADAAKGEYDVLWVAALDRITRSNQWSELGEIFGAIQKAKIKLAGPGLPPMDLDDSMSMMNIFWRITMAYADNQRRINLFMDGKKGAAIKGCHVQGPVPYGLTWRTGTRDASGWGIDEKKARLVREAFRRVLAGESGHMVARDFEQRGEVAPRGGRWFEPISRFLKSPVYRGETSYYGVPVKVPALVSEDDWYRVQAILGTSKMRGRPQAKHEYLVEGLGVCSFCGSPIYMRTAENKFHYYVCRDRTDIRKDMSQRCELPRFRTDTIDSAVWSTIADWLSQPRAKILAALRGHEANATSEADAWEQDMKACRAQLDALEASEGVIMEQLEAGLISANAFRDRAAKTTVKRRMLQEQLKTAQAALEGAGRAVNQAGELEAILDEVRALVGTASFQERKTLVRSLVAKGGLKFDRLGAHVTLTFSEKAARVVTLRVAA